MEQEFNVKNKIYKYSFLQLLLVLCVHVHANNFTPLDNSQFDKLSSKIDYTKDTKRTISLKEFRTKETSDDELNPFALTGLSSLFGFMNILAYLLIIALVGIILYFLLNSIESKDQKILYEDSITEEEDIEDIDAMKLYLTAMENKDYRTAIRMRFILVLQKFTEQELINWQPEKTNRDYKRELRTSEHYRFFESASNIYDRIWYGNEDISFEDFKKVNPYFEVNPQIQ